MHSQKWRKDLGSFPRQIIQHQSNPSPCPDHWCQRTWIGMVLRRTTRPFTTNMKRCPFYHRGLEFQCRKSRDTWSNRQVWRWSTKCSRAKANRVLPRKHTGNSKHPLPAMQEMTLLIDINRWSMLKYDGLYSLQPEMEKLHTVSKNKPGGWLWLR